MLYNARDMTQTADDADISSSTKKSKPTLIAPVWHTVVLVVFLLGLSWWGARAGSLVPPPVAARTHGHVVAYIFVIVIECLVVLFVLYGLRLRKLTLKELIGPRKLTLMNVVRDLGIALLFFIGSNIILGIFALIVRAGHNPAIRKISPSGAAEIILYLLVSLSAGICEEIVCRGYLQKQLIGLTKSTSAGILLQGIIFGAAHGYQGTKFMIVIGVYGCLFGLLAQFRNSLYPGMMTHALQDGIAGLIVRNMAR